MRKIALDKVVINIGTGSDDPKQASAKRLLELITGRKPMDERSKKRIPAFKISPGTKIGAFVTVREETKELAKRLLDAVDNRLKESSISNNTASFGIREYIDISGVKYDPKIGMLGMNVNLSFKRPGMCIERRKIRGGKVAKHHAVVSPKEIKEFMQRELKTEIVE